MTVGTRKTMPSPSIYYTFRRALVWCADRVGEWCDRRTVDAYRLGNPAAQRLLRGFLQGVGRIGHVLKLLPRLDAFRFEGPGWNAVFVGDTMFLSEWEYLLFPDGAVKHTLERVPAWRLRAFAAGEASGSDLVVCSLPQIWPACWRPRARVMFTTPVWVNAVLDVREPLAAILRGRSGPRKGLRNNLNLSRRSGTVARLTRSRADLEHFYQSMYLPHVRRRHGERALVSRLEDHWTNWIEAGGHLVLIEHDGLSLAGVLTRSVGSTYWLGEEGVAQGADVERFAKFLRVALRAAAVEHAQSLGLPAVVMGRSLAHCSDPVLSNKLLWGARVTPPERCFHPEWTFLGGSLPDALRRRLNAAGLVTLSGSAPAVVWLERGGDAFEAEPETIGQLLIINAD
jgi:hypothetical protein